MIFEKNKDIYETRIRRENCLKKSYRDKINEEVEVLRLINNNYNYRGYIFLHFIKIKHNDKSVLKIHSIEPLDGAPRALEPSDLEFKRI